MKYEYLHEIESDSSLGKFLAQIEPNSVVLECGCASGYMTRAMKEKLNCQVYIVEYNPEGFDLAIQYAVDGICGDLMQDRWIERFSKIKFDYILFADVLEHVSDPLKVLKSATSLLKEDGSVMVSLPNIGHNDVVVKLLQGNWDYTSTGLLDDTHVHFWGINNLDNFFSQAGLEIIVRDCVIVATGHTEQCSGRDLLLNDEIYAAIKNRPEGEIYQFTLTLKKKEYLSKTPTESINRYPKIAAQSLSDESLHALKQALINKDGHIEQLIQSERELQGDLQRKEGHIEMLLQSERDLLSEKERLVAKIRQLQYELGYQTSMANYAQKSEKTLKRQLDEARRTIDQLQHALGSKVSENRMLQEETEKT